MCVTLKLRRLPFTSSKAVEYQQFWIVQSHISAISFSSITHTCILCLRIFSNISIAIQLCFTWKMPQTFIQLIGVDVSYIDDCIVFIPLWREIMVSLTVVVFPLTNLSLYTSASLWLNPKKMGGVESKVYIF